MRYAVNATLAEMERATVGPVAWDVAAYGGLLQLDRPELSVEFLPRGRRLRLERQRLASIGRASVTDPPSLDRLFGMPTTAPSHWPRWLGGPGGRRVLARIGHTDLVAPPRGVDAVISHLRRAVAIRPGTGEVRTTTGVIPELWRWRRASDSELVRAAHVAQELAFGNAADQVICWTQHGADNLVHAGLAAHRIAVATPILRLADPTGPAFAGDGHVRAVFVSGAAWLKGLPEALAAVQATDGVALHVVGGVPPRDPPPRTRWHGRLEPGRVARLLESADVLLGPARQETLGVSYLEAMRAGVAVIGSTIGTVKELVGETGRLVPPGNADAVTVALQELTGDGAMRREMGQAGQRRYEAHYAPEVAARAWEKLLR